MLEPALPLRVVPASDFGLRGDVIPRTEPRWSVAHDVLGWVE